MYGVKSGDQECLSRFMNKILYISPANLLANKKRSYALGLVDVSHFWNSRSSEFGQRLYVEGTAPGLRAN